MFLHKFPVVFFGLLTVVFIEPCPRILLGRWYILSWATGWISVRFSRDVRAEGTHGSVAVPQILHYLVPLQGPDWIKRQRYKTSLIQGITVRWCSVLDSAAQVCRALASPRSKSKILSKETDRYVVRRTELLELALPLRHPSPHPSHLLY